MQYAWSRWCSFARGRQAAPGTGGRRKAMKSLRAWTCYPPRPTPSSPIPKPPRNPPPPRNRSLLPKPVACRQPHARTKTAKVSSASLWWWKRRKKIQFGLREKKSGVSRHGFGDIMAELAPLPPAAVLLPANHCPALEFG